MLDNEGTSRAYAEFTAARGSVEASPTGTNVP